MSEYPGYKKCFVDVETTGTDRKLNHIFQISGKILDIDDTVLESFNWKFRPISLDNVVDEALGKTGMTLEDLASLPFSAAEIFKEFQSVLGRHCNKFDKKDKYQLIGYNTRFDEEFLRELWNYFGDNYFGSWFFSPSIDLFNLSAWLCFNVRSTIPNMQLGTICKLTGIGWDENKAHDADYDITQSIKLFEYLKKIFPN